MPLSRTVSFGPRIPYCVIAIELTSLKVEPGAYTPWVARFDERVIGVVVQRLPLALADAVDERADVVVRERRHRHDRAVGDVHREHRAARRLQLLEALALDVRVLLVARRRDALRERGLGRVLPVRVDRQRDVVADGARLHVERVADRRTGRVDLDLLAAGLPTQLLLERALGAVLADRVALLVARVAAGSRAALRRSHRCTRGRARRARRAGSGARSASRRAYPG